MCFASIPLDQEYQVAYSSFPLPPWLLTTVENSIVDFGYHMVDKPIVVVDVGTMVKSMVAATTASSPTIVVTSATVSTVERGGSWGMSM